MNTHQNKTLLIVLPYGIGWDSIVNKKNLDILTGSGLRIVLLCESNMFSTDNPNVVVKTLKKSQRTKSEIAFGLLRNYVFSDTSKQHSETLKIKISELDQSHKFLSIVRRSIGKVFAKSSVIKNILSWIDCKFFVTNDYDNIFFEFKPDYVFITYPFSFYTYPVMRYASNSKIPIIGYVPSWDNLTSKWEVPIKLDKLIVWNDIMKKEAINFLGYNDSQIEISGVPQFDLHSDISSLMDRTEFINSVHGDVNKKILLYATGTTQLSDAEPEIVKMIYEMINNDSFDKPCQLLLRVHPRRNISDFQNIVGKPNVIFQTPGRKSDEFQDSGYIWKSDLTDSNILSNTLNHSDIMINVASTITIESCLFNTPVINIGFDANLELAFNRSVARHFQYSHYLDIVNSNGVKIAKSQDDLLNFINRYLLNPDFESEGRKKIVDTQCHYNDGKSSERLLRYIIDFTNQKSV